jgi:hypothetical protein
MCTRLKCGVLECVLLLQNVFSYDTTLPIGCVLSLQNAFSYYTMCSLQNVFSYYRLCSHAIEHAPQNDRMCSLTTECVLLLQNVFSYYRCVRMLRNTRLEIVVLEDNLVIRHISPDLGLLCVVRNTFCSKRTHSVVREHIL